MENENNTQLYEYIQYNYSQKNMKVAEVLENIVANIDAISDENTKRKLFLALGLSKGYTEYKTKEIAKNIGSTKTAVKYMVESLQEDKKIEIIKEHNLTFLKPMF